VPFRVRDQTNSFSPRTSDGNEKEPEYDEKNLGDQGRDSGKRIETDCPSNEG